MAGSAGWCAACCEAHNDNVGEKISLDLFCVTPWPLPLCAGCPELEEKLHNQVFRGLFEQAGIEAAAGTQLPAGRLGTLLHALQHWGRGTLAGASASHMHGPEASRGRCSELCLTWA